MKNVFVQTANVKNFYSAMKEAERVCGEPALLVFYGEAGRGKTTAARYFAAQEDWTYARFMKGWKQSELWMLQDLCFELSIDPVPHRKKTAFEAIKTRLLSAPRPVIIDECDKMDPSHLEWIRDLADVTFVPFALLGEKLLAQKMNDEKRIWSRTLRAVEFGPITAQDILFFAKQAADLMLTAQQAEILRQAAGGDFRLVSRDVRRLEGLAETNRGPESGGGRVSDEMVQTAVKQGLRGYKD